MTTHATAPEKKVRRIASFVSVLFITLSMGTGDALAQAYLTTIDLPRFAAPAPTEKGAVNLANGNLHIEIPLVAAPQRGRRGFSASLVYDSRIWHAVSGSSTTWQPTNVSNSQGGWRFVTSADVGSMSFTSTSNSSGCGPSGCNVTVTIGPFTWTDSRQQSHIFGAGFQVSPCGGAGSSTAYASDSTGLYMVATLNATCNSVSEVIYTPDGTQVYPTVEDPNGNYFSADSNGNVIDTLNRTQVTKAVNGSTTTYTVLNSQGGTSTFTVTTGTVNVHTAFSQSGVTEYSGSFSAIQSIGLPDGTSYSFTYDSGTTAGNYGLLKTMTVPAGGQVTYAYSTFQDSTGNRNRWLNTRTAQTGTLSGTWTYAPAVITTCLPNQSTCRQKVTVTQPSGDYVVHTFSLDSAWLGAWDTQQQTFDALNNLMITGTTTYDMSQGNGTYIVPLTQQVTIPVPGGASISRQTKMTYSSTYYPNGNVTAVKEWKWYSGTAPTYPTTPDRETDIAYVPKYGVITALPSTITVNGSGVMLAQTKYSYDSASQLSGITGVTHHDDGGFGISNTVRGNPTLIQRWINGTNFLNTNLYYDTTGQVTKVVDPASNATTLQYGDGNFYSDNGSNPPASVTPSVTTNAYVTQVTLPIAGTRTFGYYFNTGKRTFSRDGNGNDSYVHFLDSLDRPTHTYGPQIAQQANNRAWALNSYSGQTQVDFYRGISDTSPSISCTNCVHKQTQRDGFKRKTKTVLASDPEGAVNRDFSYDALGRSQSQSNPYRSTGDSTYGTQQPSFDALNRVLGVTLPDGNVRHTYYGNNVSTNGGLSAQLCSSATYGLGYPVLYLDPAGKKRQVWTDGFGRTIEVDEPDPSSGSLTLNTCYAHDAAGNLNSIVQGSQTRTFVHDGLSRLTSRTLPESGTTTFSYTNSSGQFCAGSARAVCYKTDARNVTTTYAYDALNRLTTKTYSDSTPGVAYFYDQTSFNGLTITNGTGRLTGIKETSGSTVVGQTAWTYDAAGRILTEKKSIGTVTKSISYSYNLDGSLASVTYPSGHAVSYTYGNAGRALSVVDSASNINYALNATFAAHGKLSGAVYAQVTGGFAGITRARTYNNRLQSTRITDSSSNGMIKDLSYSYDLGNGVNNGLVAQMVDNAVPGRTQTYTYDQLKRISNVTTQATSGGDCWGQSFTQDRYANLTNISVTKCSAPALSVAVSATSNQITSGGFTYDSAGNTTYDGTNNYTWDAENRLSSGAVVTYTYDGLGRRVSKSSGTFYWYDAQGHLLAETTTAGGLVYEYIYFAGRRIARRDSSSTIRYYFNDKANTNRVFTDATGVVKQMSDYYPYGGEHVIVGSETSPFKFNGKQLDSETNLYNSKGMYQPSSGRSISTASGSGVSSNPQSLNPYANGNNPYSGASSSYGGMSGSTTSSDVGSHMEFDDQSLAGFGNVDDGSGGGGDDQSYDYADQHAGPPADTSGNVAAPSGSADTASPDNPAAGVTPPGLPTSDPTADQSTINSILGVPQLGDPTGVKITQIGAYNGADPAYGLSGLPDGTIVSANMFQVQAIDINGNPVTGDFNLVQTPQPLTGGTDIAAPAPFPSGGTVIDNVGGPSYIPGYGNVTSFNMQLQTWSAVYPSESPFSLNTTRLQIVSMQNGVLSIGASIPIAPVPMLPPVTIP
jgi:YD repeat-containing protein